MIRHFAREKSHEILIDIRSGVEASRTRLSLFSFTNQIIGLKDYRIRTNPFSSIETIVHPTHGFWTAGEREINLLTRDFGESLYPEVLDGLMLFDISQ